MHTLDEVIERLLERYNTEELVDILGIPSDVLLDRCDDFVEAKMDQLAEELFDELTG